MEQPAEEFKSVRDLVLGMDRAEPKTDKLLAGRMPWPPEYFHGVTPDIALKRIEADEGVITDGPEP